MYTGTGHQQYPLVTELELSKQNLQGTRHSTLCHQDATTKNEPMLKACTIVIFPYIAHVNPMTEWDNEFNGKRKENNGKIMTNGQVI